MQAASSRREALQVTFIEELEQVPAVTIRSAEFFQGFEV